MFNTFQRAFLVGSPVEMFFLVEMIGIIAIIIIIY